MGYVLASEISNATSETQSLVVQTDKLAPITVTSIPPSAGEFFAAAAVTSNADGSFDVFWSVETLGSSAVPEFEQAYSASGKPVGSAVNIFAASSSSTQLPLAATGTANGGYVLPSVSSNIDPNTEADIQTLLVQTDKLAPITVTALTTPENSETAENIEGASVTSNADGSFDVFWSVLSGAFDPTSGNYLVPPTEFEQAYSATGEALGPATAIATAASNSTQNFVAVTGTASGGYVLASELGDVSGGVFGQTQTLLVQTDKLAPITVTTLTTAGLREFGGVSVTSNADGSFDVFWSVVSSGTTPSTEFEQAYSASGEALGAAIAIATASSNSQSFVAATGTSSAGGGTTPLPTVTGDILWQNKATGQASIWEMDGSTLVGGGPVTPNPGLNWTEIGTGDFNKDGSSDILWQNASTGQASVWEMNGNALIGGGAVTPNPGPSFRAVGTGDFTGDGFSDDILWQNTQTGQASIWEMNGNTLSGGGPVTPNPGLAWKAIGTGDFDKDGHSDILWQNTQTGQISIWEMNGNTLVGGGALSINPGTAWQAIGTGDFNGDGFADILFQNKNTGQVSVWEMDGTNLIGGGPVSANPGTSWHAIGTGAGGSDILLQSTSGQASIWDMSGNTITGGGPVTPSPGSTFRAVGLT